MIPAAVLVLVLVVLLLVHLQSYFYALQYLFFCRFPLLAALVLAVLLPAGMVLEQPARLIGNLADLDFYGIILVSFMATLAAWTVMFSVAGLLAVIPYRMELFFFRRAPRWPAALRGHRIDWRRLASWPLSWPTRAVAAVYTATLGRGTRRVQIGRLLLYLPLGLPIIFVTVWNSAAAEVNAAFTGVWAKVGAALLGVLLAFGVRWGAGTLVDPWLQPWLRRLFRRWQPVRPLDPRQVPDSPDDAPEEIQHGAPVPVAAATVEQALLFVLLIGALYLWAGDRFSPPQPAWADASLALILFMLMLLCLGATLLAGFLDVWRVGVLLTTLVVVAVAYTAFGIDHYYDLVPPRARLAQHAPAGAAEELDWVLEGWRMRQGGRPHPVPVIVTASGGGITASYWTAEVLGRLQRGIDGFAGSILLISGVSGGGVGAMYYVDGFGGPGHPPDPGTVKTSAGGSALTATVWGLLYRDLYRALPFRSRDRGWALEETWRRRLTDSRATLRSWRDDVEKGLRPALIFNATATAPGQRFQAGPLSAPSCAPARLPECVIERQPLGFLEVYPCWDLSVATAARLSATFPFVSPIARPAENLVPAYHLADGGYYDNHGVSTAVDFLQAILPVLRDRGAPPAVALVQIRSTAPYEAEERSGFGNAFLGPLDALMKVRSSSQIQRNDLELAQLREMWKGQIVIHDDFVFDLARTEAPLSWHLTRRERALIERAWTGDHQRQMRKLECLLSP